MAVSRGTSFKRIVGFAIKEDGCVSPRNSRDAEALTGWEVGHRVPDALASTVGYEGRDTYGSEQQENAPPRGSEGAPPAEAQSAENVRQVPRESFYVVSARNAEEQAMLAAPNVKGELKPLTQVAPSQRAQNGQQPMAEQRGVTGEASSARWWVLEGEGAEQRERAESKMVPGGQDTWKLATPPTHTQKLLQLRSHGTRTNASEYPLQQLPPLMLPVNAAAWACTALHCLGASSVERGVAGSEDAGVVGVVVVGGDEVEEDWTLWEEVEEEEGRLARALGSSTAQLPAVDKREGWEGGG
ncbi:unnamed protein product [Closterium sp. Naga37s-1]|nr:unnamed protein product [Closterium sp. Naga37s-1]